MFWRILYRENDNRVRVCCYNPSIDWLIDWGNCSLRQYLLRQMIDWLLDWSLYLPVFLFPFPMLIVLAVRQCWHSSKKKYFQISFTIRRIVLMQRLRAKLFFLKTYKCISSVKKVASKTVKLNQPKLQPECSGPSYWTARAESFRAASVCLEMPV